MTDEYPEKIIKCMDNLFPKGDKRRGDALLLQAVAFLEGKEMKLKEVIKEIDAFAKKDYAYFVKKTKLKLQPRGWKDWKLDREKLKQKLGIK